MKVVYENQKQVEQGLKDNRYLVACIHRSGTIAYIGSRNRVGFGSHEPLLKAMGASGTIDDYWRYTFNAKQGAMVSFIIPKYSAKQLIPSEKATEEIYEGAYQARSFWEKLSSQMSQDTNIQVLNDVDFEDPEGLFAYYKAQVIKGLQKMAMEMESKGDTTRASLIRGFTKKFGRNTNE